MFDDQGITFDPSEKGGEGQQEPGVTPQVSVEDTSRQGTQQREQQAQQKSGNEELLRKLSVLENDNRRLTEFYTKMQPHVKHLPTLERLANAFGAEPSKEGQGGLPKPPADIMAALKSGDPTEREEAVSRLLEYYSRSTVERILKERDEQFGKSRDEVFAKQQAQENSFKVLENSPKYKELAAFAKPILQEIATKIQYDDKMAKDHEWMNHVPDDTWGITACAYLVGLNIIQNQMQLKNILSINQAQRQANAGAMGRTAGTGGVNPGQTRRGETSQDVLSGIADDIFRERNL